MLWRPTRNEELAVRDEAMKNKIAETLISEKTDGPETFGYGLFQNNTISE